MKKPGYSLVLWIVFACLFLPALPASAGTFAQLLSSFKEIFPPFTLDRDPSGASLESDRSISIDDFETYFLGPGRLAASKVELRSLEDWAERIRNYRHFRSIQLPSGSRVLDFRAMGQLEMNGFLLLAVYCYEIDEDVDTAEMWENSYIFSFTPSGRLIDGMPFSPQQTWDWMSALDAQEFPSRTVPEDSTCHQGIPGRVTITFNSRKCLEVKDRYVIEDLTSEIGKREIGLSVSGEFRELSPKRRFLLSRVFGESEGRPGLLCVYEAEEPGQGSPLFLIWRGTSKDEPIEAEAVAGMMSDGSITARTDSGLSVTAVLAADRGSATLTDSVGKEHALRITYGPGQSGEKTRLSGTVRLGGFYDPYSRSLAYLFAPALLPVARNGGQESFDARSCILGVIPEGGEASVADAVSVGTIANESTWTLNETRVLLAPRSMRFFEEDRVVGTLAQEARIRWGQGTTVLATGTRFYEQNQPRPSWAIPAKDTAVTVKNITLKVPAGSTIRFRWDRLTCIVFAQPVPLRVGSSTITISSAGFAYDGPNHLSETTLVAPAMLSAGGKTVALIDTLTFDENGNVQSGRLQADTALTVGGKTVRFCGGYEPENPEKGIIGIFRDGRVRSGFLSASADFRVGKSTVSLVAGDGVTFRQDGGLETCTPSTMVTVSAEGRRVFFGGGALKFNPDGSIASGNLAEDIRLAVGGVRVSPTLAACTETRVRVRVAADLQALTLGYLDRGDRVVVLEKSVDKMKVGEMTDYWYRVRRVSDGLTGWSYGYFLRLGQ